MTADSLDCRVERLRYYLKHTLGCPHTFEMRRKELALLAANGGCSDGTIGTSSPLVNTPVVSDEDVVESMLNDVRPASAGERPGLRAR